MIINWLLIGVHVIASLLLVLFILLHSGRGTGLSDVFGGGGGGVGAAGAIEKNLDRDHDRGVDRLRHHDDPAGPAALSWRHPPTAPTRPATPSRCSR